MLFFAILEFPDLVLEQDFSWNGRRWQMGFTQRRHDAKSARIWRIGGSAMMVVQI
jgi:hypothetical protein